MSEKGMLVFSKYKHLIFAVIIIIIVIILDIIFENYSKTSTQKVDGTIKKICKIFEKEESEYDTQKLGELAKKADEDWEKRADTLSCFIEHEEVEKINMRLKLLKSEIKDNNWIDAKMTITEIKQAIEFLDSKYKFSLQNLF